MDRVKIGVVGTGGIFYGWGGHSGHLPAYPKIEEAEIVALCDINEESVEKARFWMKKIYEQEAKTCEENSDFTRANQLREDAEKVKIYTNHEEMFKSEKLDLVDVMTPVRFHLPIVKKALENNIHVMCEKPMARTWLECIEIVETVKKTGMFFQNNENLIYTGLWYNLRKFIESGVIGEPVIIFLPLSIGEPGALISSYWDPQISGGGSLIDMGIHGITTTWFLLGFDSIPKRVKSAQPQGIKIKMPTRLIDGIYQKAKSEDEAHILIEYETKNGWSTVFLEASWSYQDSRKPTIIGTNGSIEWEGEKIIIVDVFGNRHEHMVWRSAFLNKPYALPDPGGFLGEIKNMCNCIMKNIKPLCDEKVGAESMAIIGAAYLSEHRGCKVVTLDEFKEFALEIKKKEGENASEILIKTLVPKNN